MYVNRNSNLQQLEWSGDLIEKPEGIGYESIKFCRRRPCVSKEVKMHMNSAHGNIGVGFVTVVCLCLEGRHLCWCL